MKTGLAIQSDVYGILTSLPWLNESISGSIYRQGVRPRDSQLEDLSIIFTTADAEQMQEGVITLNLFVPMLTLEDNGTLVEDIMRCEELETLMQRVADTISVSTDYHFHLKDAIHTQRDDELKQSFVVARFGFRLLNTKQNN